MLYVLKSMGYGERGELIELIKIGFTDNWDRRFDQYCGHNPTIVPLFLIEGGDMNDEYNVCQYFQKYRSHRKEWFHYSEEIIKFFSKNTTIDDIRGAIPIFKSKPGIQRKLLGTSILDHIVSIIGDTIVDLDYQQLLEELSSRKFTNMSQVLYFIRETYPVAADEIIDNLVCWYCIRNKLIKKDSVAFSTTEAEVLDFISRNRAMNSFEDQMRALCIEKISENALPIILNQLPVRMKIFYNTLGLEGCKECGYRGEKMALVLENREKKVVISKKIHEKFSVGNRLSSKEIKAILHQIYSDLSLKRNAKATDLSEWFVVKRIQIWIKGEKKKIDGFELLSLK